MQYETSYETLTCNNLFATLVSLRIRRPLDWLFKLQKILRPLLSLEPGGWGWEFLLYCPVVCEQTKEINSHWFTALQLAAGADLTSASHFHRARNRAAAVAVA